MTTVNVHEAKTSLSALLVDAACDGEVVITRAGKTGIIGLSDCIVIVPDDLDTFPPPEFASYT